MLTSGMNSLILQTERAEGQRAVWEADVDALRQQYSSANEYIRRSPRVGT